MDKASEASVAVATSNERIFGWRFEMVSPYICLVDTLPLIFCDTIQC
jgi:hypothetical protein